MVSLVAGTKLIVAFVALYVNVPEIAAAELFVIELFVASCKVKDAGVIVVGFIASLNVTAIIWSRGTPVAEFAGFVDITTGQTPTVSTFLSSQLLISAAINKTAIAVIHDRVLLVFIILYFIIVYLDLFKKEAT